MHTQLTGGMSFSWYHPHLFALDDGEKLCKHNKKDHSLGDDDEDDDVDEQ